MPGKVYLVGAGPGAVDLLTLRAATLLREARVVLHDDLVPAEILALCPTTAEIINVGKRCGRHSRTQEQINALIVWCAGVHESVVRLKSGDPAVFGRLGEELEALQRAGVAFEIVPGITAASAAAAAANITLTHRRSASALVTITAHNARDEGMAHTMFDPLRTTFAIYMPGPNYGRTARELMDSGLAANTPCAVISNAGRTNQMVRHLLLAELNKARGIAAPALLIVGEVTALARPAEEENLDNHVLSAHHAAQVNESDIHASGDALTARP
jgi:uroporphyrin-III C-methyltransferase